MVFYYKSHIDVFLLKREYKSLIIDQRKIMFLKKA